jgi:hypothetical protein
MGAKMARIGTVRWTFRRSCQQYGIKAALFSDFGTADLLDDVDRQSRPASGTASRTTWACVPRRVSRSTEISHGTHSIPISYRCNKES